jgi:hypothetical protein
VAHAAVGKVEQQMGSAEVLRSGDKKSSEVGFDIEMRDEVRSGNGIVGIGFADKTKVRVDKHSKLVIDEFVYDPKKPNASKLGLKIALGTVRYASGLIAKQNQQSVSIRTPTASIGVRGTAFSMTVDEIGRSLVILLPNPDGTVGEIAVTSDVGTVIMNKAFQATLVTATEKSPAKPVILDLSEAQINNLLIINRPKKIEKEYTKDEETNNLLDFNELDIDYLAVNELEEEQLAFTRLDFNLLDVDLLANILDILNRRLYEQTDRFPTNPIVAGVYEEGSTQIFGGEQEDWEIYRQVDGRVVSIKTPSTQDTRITLRQAGTPDLMLHTTEGANDSQIIINQN